MSDKGHCPACDSYTSSIFSAFRDGESCPVCGFPADAAEAFAKAQEKGVAQELLDRSVAAEQRAVKAEAELFTLRNRMRAIREAVNGPDSNYAPLSFP